MKKTLLLMLVATTLTACGSKETGAETTDNGTVAAAEVANDDAAEAVDAFKKAFPWDFPAVKLDAKPGQIVLAATDLKRLVSEGKDLTNVTINLFKDNVDAIGDKTSTLKRYSGFDIPNALIIPLPEDVQAKAGDILLTYYKQGGGSLQRAIVTDATNPLQPKVNFLDMRYSDDPSKPTFGDKAMNTELEPNSFIVIKQGELVPGAQIAYKDGRDMKLGSVIAVSGDRVLFHSFARGISVLSKSEVTLVPFDLSFAPGDKVLATFAGTYKDGYTIDKVDKANGLIWVKRDIDGKVEVRVAGEVAKSL